MKIAIMNPWAISNNAIGGTERFVEDLAESLYKLGNVVDVYMFSGENHKKNNISYISLDLLGKNIIADEYMITKKFGSFENKESYKNIASKLESMIDLSSYDLVHLNSHFFMEAWKDKKRIITLHSNYEEFKVLWNDEEFNTMIDIMRIQSKNKKTKIVCPSIHYKKEWENLLQGKVYYIPHALNKKRLKCEISREKLLKKYELSEKKIKILLPSRLEPIQKRPKLILEGCSMLEKETRNQIQVLFTGIDDQYKQFIPELIEYAQKYNIDVKFIIFDSIAEGYKVTDIVAIPSKSESFGYSALESLSLGIKTILTNIPTFKEISKDNSSSYFFDGTKEELKLAILKILEENDYKRKRVDSNWLKKYDLVAFAKSYMGVFDDE